MTNEHRPLLARTAELALAYLETAGERPVAAPASMEQLLADLGGALPAGPSDPMEVIKHLARATGPGLVATRRAQRAASDWSQATSAVRMSRSRSHGGQPDTRLDHPARQVGILTATSSREGVPAMRRDQLRAMQAPLKERYRSEPEAAVVTLEADGVLGEGITCSVQTGGALARAGLHPATGGDGLSLCSGDMLLEALAACAGVTLSSVATALELEVPVRSGRVHVEGDLDFRGTLAVDKEAPVGFREIRLRFDLDTDAPAELVDKLVALTERYCVVLQTLKGTATLSSGHRRTGADAT